MSLFERAPRANFANHALIEARHQQSRVKLPVARVVLGAIDKLFDTQVYFQPGARESIQERAAREGATSVLAADHLCNFDSLNMAKLLLILDVVKGNEMEITIPGKTDLANANPLLRYVVESSADMFAVFGSRDRKKPDNIGIDDETRHAAFASSKRLIQLKMELAKLVGINPEATRGESTLFVQDFTTGTAEAAIAASTKKDIAINLIGTYYGDGVDPSRPTPAWLSPTMVVSAPITELGTDPVELTYLMQEQTQLCRDQAIDIWHQAETVRVRDLIAA